MAQRIPEINGAAIVLVGSFNPAIFQPEWFVRQNLLSETEAGAAKINAVVPQICDFETGRFQIQVTTDRFAAVSKADANPAPLRDLVLGTFFILEHTPVTAVGLNRQMHFAIGSEEDWHRLGDTLAPKDGWYKILPGRPGMRSLTIQTQMHEGRPEDPKLTIKVEPSLQVKFGVYFETNEHYAAPKGDMKFVLDTLRGRWEESYNYAAKIADHILDWGSRQGTDGGRG